LSTAAGIAHAIELLLKTYLKGVAALKPRPKKEDPGHDINRLLDERKRKAFPRSNNRDFFPLQ
jgi:hypothetical protein